MKMMIGHRLLALVPVLVMLLSTAAGAVPATREVQEASDGTSVLASDELSQQAGRDYNGRVAIDAAAGSAVEGLRRKYFIARIYSDSCLLSNTGSRKSRVTSSISSDVISTTPSTTNLDHHLDPISPARLPVQAFRALSATPSILPPAVPKSFWRPASAKPVRVPLHHLCLKTSHFFSGFNRPLS